MANTLLENTLSKNTRSENTLSENTLSENTLSENTLSSFRKCYSYPKLKNNWGPLSSTFHVEQPEPLIEWKIESMTNGPTDLHLTWVGAKDACASKNLENVSLKGYSTFLANRSHMKKDCARSCSVIFNPPFGSFRA